jgi:hypothetical protein
MRDKVFCRAATPSRMDFAVLSLTAQQETKVFWFFFSKKNRSPLSAGKHAQTCVPWPCPPNS